MRSKLFALAIVPLLMAQSVSAAPLLKVSSEVAQGLSGRGLSVVLAPRQPISINFSGEKVASVTTGDRSQFVFNVSGSVVTLTRIKPLNFPGEFSGGGRTTLHIMTIGGTGQKIYPVTILFGSRSPGYSVVEVGGNDYATSIPVQAPPPQIPLITSESPAIAPVPQEHRVSRKKETDALVPPPVEIEEIKEFPKPRQETKPAPKVEEKPKPEPVPKVEVKKLKPLPKIKRVPRPSLAKPIDRKKKEIVATNSVQEPKPDLTPSQRALLEMKQYQQPPMELKRKE
jgi:hypothetical protein